jgi:MoxR-like ATPase
MNVYIHKRTKKFKALEIIEFISHLVDEKLNKTNQIQQSQDTEGRLLAALGLLAALELRESVLSDLLKKISDSTVSVSFKCILYVSNNT